MASIYNRNGVLWIALYKDGKQICKSARLPDTKENRKRVEKELLPLLLKSEHNHNNNTFAHYKSAYLKAKEGLIKEHTLDKYANMCNAFEKLYTKKIQDIKVSEVRAVMASLNVSAKTYRNYLTVLSGIFKEAVDDEVIAKNPCENIQLPKLKKPDIELFDKAEILNLTSGTGWLDNFLGIAFFSGLRTGELIALRWEDISFERRQIRVEQNFIRGSLSDCKTEGSRRTIPMFDEAYFFLQKQYLLTGLKNGYIFLSQANTPFSSTELLAKHWKRHTRERDVIHKKLYNTRHTFAVTLLESGNFTAMDIARILGHTSVQMLFLRYAKYIKSEQKKFELNLGFDLKNDYNLTTRAV